MASVIVPYLFEKHWIISFDSKVILAFGGKLTLKASVNRQGKLVLVSKECLQ